MAIRVMVVVFGLLVFGVPAPGRAAEPLDAARIEEISTWLSAETYSATPGIAERAFWQKVAQAPTFRTAVSDAQKLVRQPPVTLPDDLYLEYSRNGNRSRYQDVYFRKLKNFRILVVAECLENKGRFLPAVEQLIASYAGDKTWVLPAHDSGQENFEGRQITIDLFSSEVACDLANADHILGAQLSETARKQIRQEVRRRIFVPYRRMLAEGKPRMWWLTGTNNWNAVCLANVTGAGLALLDDRRERAVYVAAAEKYIRYFLRGFTDDGYCSEGIGYWNYGFGCFVRLGHMLGQATGGKVDLFALPKVRSAGLFARRIEISGGQYPAFADCSVGSAPDAAIMQSVTRQYQLEPTEHERTARAEPRWLDEFGVFAFLFEPPAAATATAQPAIRDWFEDAGILIGRAAKTRSDEPLGVALKGGHNAEHHNHNDVGSYIVCVGRRTPLVDPGAEVYTRRTFSGQRYESGVLNSFGHPVPLVAGQMQRTGRNAQGRVLQSDFTDTTDTLALDLTSAYAVKPLEQLTRTFTFRRQPGELVVADTVRFTSPQTFGTALITFDPVTELGDQQLRIGTGRQSVTVHIDTGGLPLSITQTTIDEDVRGGRKPTRIGLDLQQPVERATIRVTVQ